MIPTLFNGQIVQLDVPLPPVTTPRVISSEAFLALWTPQEVQASALADAMLFTQMIRVACQGTVNLDSPLLAPLLNLAVSKNTLTPGRAAQIAAGTPPPT